MVIVKYDIENVNRQIERHTRAQKDNQADGQSQLLNPLLVRDKHMYSTAIKGGHKQDRKIKVAIRKN